MLKKIANKIFDLFVVNRNAMAVQLKDGNYVTKYVKVTDNDIYCMLKEKKSIGSYQQLYKSPYVLILIVKVKRIRIWRNCIGVVLCH